MGQIRTFVHGPAADPALVVTGPPGIGKSVLLADLLSDLPAAGVLRARGRASESEVAFAVLSELLVGATQAIAGLPAPQRRALETALAIAEGPPPEPLALGLAVAAVLVELASGGGLVVAVDDAHEADRSSCKALGFACSRLTGEAVRVLIASRPPVPVALSALPSVELPPMGHAEVAGLARAAGWSTSDAVIADLIRRTGGNPLAISEAVRRGQSPADLAAWPSGPVDVGERLHAVYQQRIADLPARARQALLLLAVDDGTNPEGAMAALAGRGLDDAAVIAAVIDSGLVVSAGGRLAVAHPLMRSTIWHTASTTEQRQALHDLAAHERDPDRRAWYLASAALQPDEQAAATIEQTAAAALRRGAMTEAGAAFRRAAELSPSPHLRGRRYLAAATASWSAGDPSQAAVALTAAIDSSTALEVRGRAQQLMGRLQIFSGALADAEAALRGQALAWRDEAPRTAARLLSEAVWACAIDNRWGEGLALAEEATSLLPQPHADLFVHATHLANRAALGLPVDLAAVEAMAQEFLRMPAADADWLPIGFLVLNTAMLMEAGQVARDVTDRMLHHGRADGAVGVLPLTLSCASDLDWWGGDWLTATARAEEALSLAQELGDTVNVARARVTLARIRLTAEETWEQGRATVAEELGSPVRWSRSAILAASGLGYLGRGEVDRAVVDLQQAADLDHDPIHGLQHPRISGAGADLCTALVAADQREAAADWLARWAAAPGATGRWARGAVLRCRALLSDHPDEADRLSTEAVALLSAAPFERARALLEQGQRRRRAGRDARPPLRRALAIFTDLGATLWSEQARAELRAIGDRAVTRRASPLRSLSGQELRVALKVAEGMTNREVAAALFLSPKTVEAHLTRIYSRLGIRSRVDLTRLVGTALRAPTATD